jgi:hypothetical protein
MAGKDHAVVIEEDGIEEPELPDAVGNSLDLAPRMRPRIPGIRLERLNPAQFDF